MDKFVQLFGRSKSVIIGMVHLRALPGSPRCCKSVEDVTEIACQEAEIYREAKVDGIMVENMHDTPWLPVDQLGPETTAAMAVVCSALRRENPTLPLGVQMLSGGNRQATAIAKAAGLNYIRAEGFVYSHIGDEGPMHSCAADLVRYRKHIGAENIMIFTDIKKKHCSHALTSDVSIEDTARAAELFLSDGVIVTGTSTGRPTDPSEVNSVQESVNIPTLIGSGVTESNIADYINANGIIIGSHLKVKGHWDQEIDPDRVKKFMDKVWELRP